MNPNISTYMEEIEKYNLDTPVGFLETPVETIGNYFNGIGPDWFPKPVVDFLTDTLGFFAPACVIHDWEYSQKPKTDEAFKAANQRLHTNCIRLLHAKGIEWEKFPLYHFYICEMYTACEMFGKTAYLEG